MYLCSLTLSQILFKNSFGKVVFQILVTWLFSRNENSFFGRHFETKHFLIVLFADIWLFWVYSTVYTYGASFVPKFLQESAPKWMGPSGPPLMHKREWKVA